MNKRCKCLMIVLILGWGGSGLTAAAPYLPEHDTQIVERLPSGYDSETQTLKRLRNTLASDPNNLTLALDLARRHIERGRSESDPRYYGYAQAALRPWWDQAQAPPQVLVLRATLRQNQHDFAGALKDLSQALKIQARNAQAWLTQAVILQVLGDYKNALHSCRMLSKFHRGLLAYTCIASVISLSGQAEQAYTLLNQTLKQKPSAHPQERLWALTVLAEIAVRLGRFEAAEQHFQQALALDLRDIYLLSTYADFLLDQQRPEAVRTLLKDDTRPDALLLRLVLAEKQLNTPQLNTYKENLEARIRAARLRGGITHLGATARFTLQVLNRPDDALELALSNWAVQHEPRDARLVLETALAAKNPKAAQPTLNWLKQTGLEDIRLTALAKKLEGIQ